MNPGRLGEFELGEDDSPRGGDLGALAQRAGRTLEGTEPHALQLVADVGPPLTAGGLDDADWYWHES